MVKWHNISQFSERGWNESNQLDIYLLENKFIQGLSVCYFSLKKLLYLTQSENVIFHVTCKHLGI